MSLILHWDNDADLTRHVAIALKWLLQESDPNTRFCVFSRILDRGMALEMLNRLASSTLGKELARAQLRNMIVTLKVPFCSRTLFQTERDMAIRMRILSLICEVCDEVCADEIIGELLAYLSVTDDEIKEHLVRVCMLPFQALKIPIIAEKYIVDPEKYVEMALELLHVASDYVSTNLWARLVEVFWQF